MNIHELREAQLYFKEQIPTVQSARKGSHKLRQEFVNYYTRRRIQNMTLEQYSLGNDLPCVGFNFCHTIEQGLRNLGLIVGATAFKFGVYYGRTKSDSRIKYRFTKKYGHSVKNAFAAIKGAIVSLIFAGKNEDIDAILANPISPMFKGKILSTYFPDRYLNIFSDYHLEYFLVQLNLDNEELIWSDSILKREALLKFKNSDEIMKHWTVDIFSYFLYNIYPGRPPKSSPSGSDPLKDYRPPKFPVAPTPQIIDLAIISPVLSKNPRGKTRGRSENPDYEGQLRKNKRYGERGEQIVLDMERKRLKTLGFSSLAKKVKKAKYDYEGYDILSFEPNGSERYIEVKATSANVGNANFYLSINELNKAKGLTNYYVYVIFEILKQSPKIWIIKNPFHPKNPKVIFKPISYKIHIRTSS